MPTWGPTDAGAAAATTSSGLGAGNGPHLPVGTWSGTRYRSAIRFALPGGFASWTSISKATLKVRTTDFAHVGPRNSTIVVKRMAVGSPWTKGSGTQNCNDGFSGGNATQYDDISPTSSPTVAFQSGTTENSWKSIDVTDIVKVYHDNQPDPSVLVFVLDQQDSSDYSEFWSDDKSGSEPTLQIDYIAQAPPTAPTLISPGANAAMPMLRPPFQWKHNDPQGDPQVDALVQVFAADGTTLLYSLHPLAPADQFTTQLPADLVRGTTYKWRAQTYDAGGAGAWSGLQTFSIQPLPVVAIDATRRMEWANAAPRLRVNWSVTGNTQAAYRVQAGAFDSGWIIGSATTFLLDTVALVNNVPVNVTVSVDSEPAYGIIGTATRSFTPRYGLTTHRRDLTSAPLNWGSPTIVSTVPVGATLRIEYGSDPAANAAPASGWFSDLASVPKNRYLFWRAWFIPSATAGPVLDTVTIPADSTAVLVDKWGTTRDVTGLSGVWAIDPGEAVYGTRSMRADVSGAGPFKVYSYGIRLRAGRNYILTGLMKSSGNSGAFFQLEDGAGNVLQGGGMIAPPGPVKSTVLTATLDWFDATNRDVNRYKTVIYLAPADMTVYVVLGAGGTAGAKAWWDAIKLEESTVATPWSPGAIGAVIMDAGGLQVDGTKGGILRYRGSAAARDVLEGGPHGLLLGGDTELAAPAAGQLTANGVPLLRSGDNIALMGGNKPWRFVPLAGSYIQAIPDGTAVTVAHSSDQVTAEITGVPIGTVAVQGHAIFRGDSAQNREFDVIHWNGMVALQLYNQVVNINSTGLFIATTGGTNGRQMKWKVNSVSGNMSCYIRLTGYWVTD